MTKIEAPFFDISNNNNTNKNSQKRQIVPAIDSAMFVFG